MSRCRRRYRRRARLHTRPERAASGRCVGFRLPASREGPGSPNGVLVDVPSHFFKLAFDLARVEAIAFILPSQKLETKDLPKFLHSIDDIEDCARLDFLPVIWDGAEQAVEKHKQPRLWEKPPRAECAALG